MKICGIYGIRNIVNGKWYVGQSTNVNIRKIIHFSCLKHGCHHNGYLQNSFLKHGKNNFEFRILEETPENMLDVREGAWIIYYKSNQKQFGYNMDSGGNLNKLVSIETCRKIGEATKRWISQKGHPFLGKHHSLETRQNSKETRRKMSEVAKNRKH
jgi:group I intron endonuclease